MNSDLLEKLEQLSLDNGLGNEFRGLMTKLCKFWTDHSKSREAVKAEQHKLMWSRATPALNELLIIGKETDGENLFNKLVAFCILMSGLGSPRSEAVVKETYPALQSVVKKNDVTKLIDLGRSDREQHLLELVQIVMGIRLFNKDCCKGGEGIDDLPELLTRAVIASKIQHKTSLESVQKRIQRLTAFTRMLYKFENSGLVLNLACSAHDLERFKSALTLFWAQNFYLTDLLVELTMSEQNISHCVDQLRETLVQLHETVRYRAAIPTIQVYPLFVQLSLVWRELQYEAAVLSHFSQIMKAVATIADDLDVPFERLAPKTSEMDLPVSLETFKFNEFCPWILIQSDGILIPGSIKDENFTFYSEEARKNWFLDLATSYSKLKNVLNAFPELRNFFKIEEDFAIEPTKVAESPIMTAEAEVQTETHPIQSHIDQNYTWSEWQLKKRSVSLAKLVQKSTKSQQTVESQFRVDKSVQLN